MPLAFALKCPPSLSPCSPQSVEEIARIVEQARRPGQAQRVGDDAINDYINEAMEDNLETSFEFQA